MRRAAATREEWPSPADQPDASAAEAGPSERACSVQRTVNILSDAWGFLILREAFFGVRSFEGFRAALDIPRATLSDRLARLTAAGIFRKEASSAGGKRKEYPLTPMGIDLYPSFIALMQFGDRWLSEGRPPLTLVHAGCGEVSRPIVACSECREEVGAREVTYRDGPGAGRDPGREGRGTRRFSDDAKFLLGRPSSVARTLQIIGDRWSFMVAREAFFGVRRYDQMKRSMNIAPNILTDRLNRFVEKGLFERRLYQSNPPRHEYVMTPMGRDLYGPFIAMLAWGDRWLAGGRPPLILTHKGCGRDFTPTVICHRCREPIEAASMRYRLNYEAGPFTVVPHKARQDRGEPPSAS
jgi:DNA-binding HxlR family transcriptional regulator